MLVDENCTKNYRHPVRFVELFENVIWVLFDSLGFFIQLNYISAGMLQYLDTCCVIYIQVQLTDFENAAYMVFMVLLTRVILTFHLNFIIPISKVTHYSLFDNVSLINIKIEGMAFFLLCICSSVDCEYIEHKDCAKSPGNIFIIASLCLAPL